MATSIDSQKPPTRTQIPHMQDGRKIPTVSAFAVRVVFVGNEFVSIVLREKKTLTWENWRGNILVFVRYLTTIYYMFLRGIDFLSSTTV